LLRARRCREKGWPEYMREAYHRHRWLVEGIHGEAKCEHGLRRAVRRGLSNVRIQAYLTAAVINLKRLAARVPAALRRLFCNFLRLSSPPRKIIAFLPGKKDLVLS